MSQPFTVIVPARLASTRLPNKPLADINGLPMVVRVAQRAALSAATQVVVAADSPHIVKACEEHGVRVLLTQVNHPSGSDRLAEASQLLGLSAQDMVVNVQGDEPLIDPQLINDVNSLPQPAALRHIGIYGYRVGFLHSFPQLPPAPVEQCEALEQLRALWHGHKIAVHVTDKAPGPGVDTPEDLARVQALFAA